MTYLGTLDEFEDELEALYETAPQAAGLIDALIEELSGDEDCLRTLSDRVPKWLYFTHQPLKSSVSSMHGMMDATSIC